MARQRTPAAKAARPKRTRRSAAQARAAILDAAEQQLRQDGPAAVRLQDVAAAVGVSHPTILHHFGSREALIEAVVSRAMDQLEVELLRAVSEGSPGEAHTADMLDRVFAVLGERGYGRIMAWILLSGQQPRKERAIRSIAQALHARRTADQNHNGGSAPPFEDTLFTVLCAALAMFGDAVAGREMRASAGLDPDTSGKQFRLWLARLLLDHVGAAGADVTHSAR